jgi:hypothetical protein
MKSLVSLPIVLLFTVKPPQVQSAVILEAAWTELQLGASAANGGTQAAQDLTFSGSLGNSLERSVSATVPGASASAAGSALVAFDGENFTVNLGFNISTSAGIYPQGYALARFYVDFRVEDEAATIPGFTATSVNFSSTTAQYRGSTPQPGYGVIDRTTGAGLGPVHGQSLPPGAYRTIVEFDLIACAGTFTCGPAGGGAGFMQNNPLIPAVPGKFSNVRRGLLGRSSFGFRV